MFDLGTDWWEIIVRTVVVYVAVIAGFRLTGKRQIGQMAPFDLVLILLIANAVQNAMVGSDSSLLGGLISAAALLAMNTAVAGLRDRVPMLGRVVEGEPAVLISDGNLVPERIRHERIDMLELEQAVREHGLAGVSAVKMAVLEVDGTISIIPQDQETIRTRKRFRQHRTQS